MKLAAVICTIALLNLPSAWGTEGPILLRVDFARTNGIVRPLHGINKGSLATGGMIDLTEKQRELSIPFTRLHDCQWPYPEVVDMHAIFRNPAADPMRPESYDFVLTDAYLAALQKTGAQIVYRLGESIEHGPVKRFVHPPRYFEHWIGACLGIIRHYNEGWAYGSFYKIRYWEIWNEPENRPAMWSGSDEDYIRLYENTAQVIKARFSDLKVGGPALGYSGKFEAGRFVPSDFLTNFLASCRRDSVPLDFLSWHCYTTDPLELVARARAIRQLLDQTGFTNTESHLNEWNYLPGNSWDAFSKTAAPELRRQFYERMAGPEGAAFVATALIELQDAPVDMCNFYHGELGGFGLFDEYGAPNRVFYAMRAFSEVARLEQRFVTQGQIPGKLALLAARDKEQGKAAVLISHFGTQQQSLQLEFPGVKDSSAYEIWLGDGRDSWRIVTKGKLYTGTKLDLDLPSYSVALIRCSELR